MADPKEFKDDPKYWWLKETVQDATSDLQRLHKAGQKIEGLIGPKSYGAGCMEKLAKGLSKSVSQLSSFRKYSQQWTRNEIKQLLAKAEKKNIRLSWHHFRSLLSITPREFQSERKAKAKRKELISRCIDEGWSTRQMHVAVQEALGPREDPRTGPRALAKPESIDEGLTEFIDHTEAYLRRFDESGSDRAA